jgi:hypothetical protein
MTGGSVMDWWGEGRGARPLVVRDMSSGARDRTCVEGALLSALQGYGRPDQASRAHARAKTTSGSARTTRCPRSRTGAPGFTRHSRLSTWQVRRLSRPMKRDPKRPHHSHMQEYNASTPAHSPAGDGGPPDGDRAGDSICSVMSHFERQEDTFRWRSYRDFSISSLHPPPSSAKWQVSPVYCRRPCKRR